MPMPCRCAAVTYFLQQRRRRERSASPATPRLPPPARARFQRHQRHRSSAPFAAHSQGIGGPRSSCAAWSTRRGAAATRMRRTPPLHQRTQWRGAAMRARRRARRSVVQLPRKWRTGSSSYPHQRRLRRARRTRRLVQQLWRSRPRRLIAAATTRANQRLRAPRRVGQETRLLRHPRHLHLKLQQRRRDPAPPSSWAKYDSRSRRSAWPSSRSLPRPRRQAAGAKATPTLDSRSRHTCDAARRSSHPRALRT